MDENIDDANTEQNVVEDRSGIDEEFTQLNVAVDRENDEDPKGVHMEKTTTSKDTLERSMLKVLELLAGISQLTTKAKESAELIPSNAERKVFAESVKYFLSLIVDTEEFSDSHDNMALTELVSAFPIPPPLWDNNDAGGHWLPLHWISCLTTTLLTNDDVCSILRSNENMGIDGKYGHRHGPRARVVTKNNGTYSSTSSLIPSLRPLFFPP